MILVTGASGLLGSSICRHLLLNGFEVTAIKRKESDVSLLEDVNERICWKEADLTNSIQLDQVLSGIETVIHCAAVVSYRKSEKKNMYAVNIRGTENIVNASITNGVKNFVHVSSIGALGRPKGKQIIDESENWSDSINNTEYGYTKYRAELEVFRGQAEGLNIIVLNPSVILGPSDWNRSSTRLFKAVYSGQRFYTNGFINCVDVRDVCEITLQLLMNKHFGERFIINAAYVPNKQFLSTIAKQFKKNPPSYKANSTMLKIAWLLESFKSTITKKNSLLTKETIKVAQSNINFDNSKIVKLLKYNFRTFEDSIQWTCMKLSQMNDLK